MQQPHSNLWVYCYYMYAVEQSLISKYVHKCREMSLVSNAAGTVTAISLIIFE